MKLSQLLKDIDFTGAYSDCEVSVITDNSKRIEKNCVFVCIEGAHFDGHTAAADALSQHAAAVVCQKDMGLDNQILVENTRAAYTLLCSAFFGNPASKLKLIGVTGTNGKTTTSFILKGILEHLGFKVGLVGTIKNMVASREYPAALTTPDPYDLFSLFNEMVLEGCEYCVMEVSSQALDQRRVEGVHFAAAIFTNLTRDHLDYHGTFDNYRAAKRRLFENTDLAVVNIDDEAAAYMIEGLTCRVATFSALSDSCDYTAKNIRIDPAGVKYEIVGNGFIGRVKFAVPGIFSVYNSMGAAVCLSELGFDLFDVLESLTLCKGIPGRMEVVPTPADYTVIIDYAHSPDGLENLLGCVNSITKGRVITVFGCGGDRDKTKRPLMGKIACELSDVAVITSDNPRSEPPEQIIDEILAGAQGKAEVIVIPERRKAIAAALDMARQNDVVLLAGKGHETYQILNSGKIHFDEREEIANYFLHKNEDNRD